jgi:predicted ester cyclase
LSTITATNAESASKAIQVMAAGSLKQVARYVHPDATNRESNAEPFATRGKGPAAFHATALWLRAAFSDLVFTSETVLTEGDLVAWYGTMSGRQTGDFEVWNAEGVERVFPATGREFTVRQAHFQRIQDGLVIEHWAVRDDQGMAIQLGWIPPTPAFLFRSARATARAKRREAGR